MNTQASIADDFRQFSVVRIQRTEAEIDRCLDRLTDAQTLYRGGEYENSIANLLLHLEGNVRQWILHGVAGEPDVRTRDAEFALELTLPVAAMRQRLAATLAAAREVIAAVPDARLLDSVNPQPGRGWDGLTALGAIAQVVGHLQQHAGQIILLTKQRLATDLDLSIPRPRTPVA